MTCRYLVPLVFLTSLSCLTSLSGQTGVNTSKVIETYCSDCHTGGMRSASGALLEQIDLASISASPDLWARAYREIQAGTMPPAGAPRPDRATSDAVLTSLESGKAKQPAVADSQEIATRLASLLWNSAPDGSLLQDAQRNRLSDPATLERQIHRMLADDRAEAFVARFFFPWLQLDQLGKADPDKKYFPDYDISLRDSLAKETELFLLSQLRDDRDPIELWTANYTFVNEQLAKHYDIPGVSGPAFRRVSLSNTERAGLLGQGSILMVTSRHQHGIDAGYTTPATRGRWVRVHFLGTPTPGAAPNAKPVKPELPITPQTRVLPVDPCVTCHNNFFPLGYALENFDPVGRWRTQDQAGPVDASGTMVDGTPFHGVVELREALLEHPDAFRTTITEKLLAYSSYGSSGGSGGGSGAPFNATPETLTRALQILRGTEKPRWSALIAAIVRTKPLAIE